MADHFYSPESRLDLLELWEFIAQDNVDAADRVQEEVQQAVFLVLRCFQWNPAVEVCGDAVDDRAERRSVTGFGRTRTR